MSLRKQKVSEDYTIIVDGRETNLPSYDKDTIAALRWQRYLDNISPTDRFKEPERNVEYF